MQWLDDHNELGERLDVYEQAWGFHAETQEMTSGYGHHMAQLLYRMPHDGQTDDIQQSIEGMLKDLRAMHNRLTRIRKILEAD